MKKVEYIDLSDTNIVAVDKEKEEVLASIIKKNDRPKLYKIKFRDTNVVISAKVNSLRMAKKIVQFYRKERYYGDF